MRISDLLFQGQQTLAKLDTARLDSEILLAFVLQKTRAYLFAHPEQMPTELQFQEYQRLLVQRAKKIPIAYLLGEKEFWSLKFKVTPDVLIPRPETELLVEKILEDYAGQTNVSLVDVGTGSGAIAIALAYEKPAWQIMASDVNEAALGVAQENIGALLTSQGMTLIHSHWFDQFPQDHKFDVIVSNPPYLAENDPHLQDTEISYEPKTALVAEKNGLAAYECLAMGAKKFLKLGGRLYLEHGAEQADSIQKILKAAAYEEVLTLDDLAGLPRVTIGYWGLSEPQA